MDRYVKDVGNSKSAAHRKQAIHTKRQEDSGSLTLKRQTQGPPARVVERLNSSRVR